MILDSIQIASQFSNQSGQLASSTHTIDDVVLASYKMESYRRIIIISIEFFLWMTFWEVVIILIINSII